MCPSRLSTKESLSIYEAETHEASAELREHLNQYYDEFVEKYGYLNEKQNVKFILMDANGTYQPRLSLP